MKSKNKELEIVDFFNDKKVDQIVYDCHKNPITVKPGTGITYSKKIIYLSDKITVAIPKRLRR